MKRGWLAPILIAMALLLGGIEYGYVMYNTDAYTALLDEADKRMEERDFAGAESTAKRLTHRFHLQSAVFNIFEYHSEVGEIENELNKMTCYAHAGDASEFSASSACARREIQNIRRSKQLRWENIF